MGPYCQYCGRRCFAPITYTWPLWVQRAYGNITIAATCKQGQAHEKAALGVCYADGHPKP